MSPEGSGDKDEAKTPSEALPIARQTEGPPRGVATMSVIRWILVLVADHPPDPTENGCATVMW